MDFQFWIYLIVAIVYFIARAMKKAEVKAKEIPNKNPGRPVQYDPQPAPGKPKALTFEELLKEITEAKQASQPSVKPAPQPVRSAPLDYDDETEDEEQDLEEVNEDYRKRDKVYDTYEEARRQAFARPSLEETMNVRNTNVQFGKFKAFEQEKQRNLLEEYTRDFQDPEGFKKAVVMSEILNRKF
jgi:hypothetical protein